MDQENEKYNHIRDLILSNGFKHTGHVFLYNFRTEDNQIGILIHVDTEFDNIMEICMYAVDRYSRIDDIILEYDLKVHTDEYMIRWIKESMFELRLMGLVDYETFKAFR